jgi:hypothetical protein
MYQRHCVRYPLHPIDDEDSFEIQCDELSHAIVKLYRALSSRIESRHGQGRATNPSTVTVPFESLSIDLTNADAYDDHQLVQLCYMNTSELLTTFLWSRPVMRVNDEKEFTCKNCR